MNEHNDDDNDDKRRESIKPHRPSHVSRAGDDLVVVKEPAAWQVTVVSRQFAADSHIALACLEAVDGTNVVESSARHEVTRRRVGACHHPARAKRDSMQLQAE